MAEDIKYQINVQLADNTVTKDDLTDKIFTIVPIGTDFFRRCIVNLF